MIIDNIEEYYQSKYQFVAGVDEVGRGSIAGPVVAAAVILPKNAFLKDSGIDDSKKLTSKKREYLFNLITEIALAYSVAFIDNQTIDKINILKSTMCAMNKAIEGLKIKPEFLLIDGNYFSGSNIEHSTIIKGDEKCISISAASIIAKVTRDKYMSEVCHPKYPEYEFNKNKGYGVKKHIEAIKKHGISPYHRISFLKKFDLNFKIDNYSLF
ncbi:MAG: ribonuclease HII [Bacteroidota bacterium]